MPQPAGSINLIPQEERAEQKRTKAIKASTVFAIVLFVVVGCASAYVRYSVYKLQNQVEMHEENISQLRAEIQNMAEIEVVARNLDKKYAALQEAFDARIYYSTLLTELRNRLSSGVQVN